MKTAKVSDIRQHLHSITDKINAITSGTPREDLDGSIDHKTLLVISDLVSACHALTGLMDELQRNANKTQ